MIKHIPENFQQLLLQLANQSIQNGELDPTWKLAHIKMIPKTKNKREDPKNYRPISLLSCIGKLIERIIQAHLYNYIESKNLLIHQQSGFRQSRRTADNLIYLSQKVQESFNRKKKVGTIFFDISKAFDEVWHKGLLAKMILLEIPYHFIKWTRNFLENRSFKINVDGSLSDPGKIVCGCPQGAILSPLLFNIYINDIPIENQKRKSFSLLFADDLATSFFYKTKATFIKKASLYLKKIESWSSKWRLKMNTSKSNYTLFCKGNTDKICNLKLFSQPLPHNPKPKFLGIVFDERLCFGDQIKYIQDKCLSRLNLIKILSHRTWKLGKNTLINIYRSLVGSVIDYNFFILPFVSSQNLNRLQSIQNKALRCILKLPFNQETGRHYSTESLNNLSGLGSISARLTELKKEYLKAALNKQNPLICPLIEEYLSSRSEIEKEGSSPSILTGVESIT